MKKPNVLLINCDDLGYGDLSCYGSTKNHTPYLDKLADEGMRFTDFYMASGMCTPSRGAMMTGCYPPRVGFGEFHGEWVLFPGHDIGLNPTEITMANMFKNAGYATMHVGKWHCGDQPGFLPTDHGFDEYYGLPYSNDMGRMPMRSESAPLPLMHGSEVIEQQPDQCTLTERYVEKCVEFIRGHRDFPFFLYLAHLHVHLPLYVAPTFLEKSQNGAYGACVAAIDWVTGALVHALKHYGVYEDTVIIFTSDNGSRNDFGESNGVLRGSKGTTFEGGFRVPLIVHWKGHVASGVSDALFTSIDLFPTLAKLADGKVPEDRVIDGIEMLDVMLGKQKQSKREDFFYYMGNNLEAVRVGDWKLHVCRRPNAGKPSECDRPTEELKRSEWSSIQEYAVTELYNLKDDPSETCNVYNSHSDVAVALLQHIDDCRLDIGDAFTRTRGANVRPIGKVETPKPLTQYDPDYPYIIAMYDRNESG